MQGDETATDAAGAEVSKPAATEAAAPIKRGGLMRNTVYLTLSQVLTIPIAVASHGMMGHYLGPAEVGYIYLASTQCSFAYMAIEWGHGGSVPALIARDRDQTGAIVGTSLLWRLAISLPALLALAVASWVQGFGTEVRWALALTFASTVIGCLAMAYKDAIRGLERLDIPALMHVMGQVLLLAATAPILLLGGHFREVLGAQIVVNLVILAYAHHALLKVGISKLRFAPATLKPLLSIGTPFVFLGLTMVVLPNVNAYFLADLVPPEVLGWYSVSQRLIGLVLVPASALIGALYPTLCRLHIEDKNEFLRVSRTALYGVSLLAIPAAVGTGLFPELGVAIFGIAQFHGAIEHLQVMAPFVFLVYFSMPLGTLLTAGNRQKVWALVQCICIVVALIGNPLLVPWFQKHSGNGALGTCVSLVAAELLVIACGVALAPRGVFSRELGKSIGLSTLAGGAMALVAYFTKPVSLLLAVPLSLAVYAGVAWLTGAIQPATVTLVSDFLKRKLSRAR